jgi:bifunctional UDP-N-acetylglucosamine pyrophosphorylase/glucosamine-1-phosphate N-acetyltransferase
MSGEDVTADSGLRRAQSSRGWAALVLAAGEGRRLGGGVPKVLREVGGRPMLEWVIDSARGAGASKVVVVVGHGRESVVAALPGGVEWVVQDAPRGTGDAVRSAESALGGWPGDCWVLSGDVPGIRQGTLTALAAEHRSSGAACTLLTMELEDPKRYGRVVRDGRGRVARIVEFADATDEEKAIGELNSGTYAFRAADLFATLPRLTNGNAQGEHYLTDVVRLLIDEGHVVAALKAAEPRECVGADTLEALTALRAAWVAD